jgi:hypothetical protein
LTDIISCTEAPARECKAFLEELIVRRELAVNFVRYNPRFTQVQQPQVS